MKAYGEQTRPHILAKEINRVRVINLSLWGGHYKEKMHLNKENPEDKMYGGAKDTTKYYHVPMLLCIDNIS